MTESELREQICEVGKSIFNRGLTHGSTGNLSVRLEEGWLLTPTGSSLGHLLPERLTKLDGDGKYLSGDPPTKETFLHLTMYRERPALGAVVHLHSTYSVAVSVLGDVNPADVLPPITAYYVMRVGSLPLVPFYPPGDPALADAVALYAGKHHALLLANHGPVVGGSDLLAASDATEELEETAKLYLLLRGHQVRTLSPEQVAVVHKRWG
ncbi:MAG: aldolase [Meiothermus sp.]